MPWRDAQALHIFAPIEQPDENWVEQILGTVIRPMLLKYERHVRWLWVTRYIEPLDFALRDDIGEYAQKNPIPDNYVNHTNGDRCRYIVFRLSAEAHIRDALHSECEELANQEGYFVVPWVDFDAVGGLGNDRFINQDADDTSRIERARLILNFMDSTVRLMIHSLVETGGQWRQETNADTGNNPNGSFFQSVHHLFCNATKVPTSVLIGQTDSEANQTILFTSHYGFPNILTVSLNKLPEIDEQYRGWMPIPVKY